MPHPITLINCPTFESFIHFFGHENWTRTLIVKNKGEVQGHLHRLNEADLQNVKDDLNILVKAYN